MTEPTRLMHFRSAMLERPRALFGWLGRRLFDHVALDPTKADALRALPARGQIVYVMRTRSLLDYLFFNYLFLKAGLPLARFANEVDLTFFRGLREWIADRWRRVLGRNKDEPTSEDQLAITVHAGQSALLFLKRRAWVAERHERPHHIERLVELQRASDTPILLVPQLINWPRQPPSKRRTLTDIVFGDRDASGRLRKLGHFIRFHRMATVQIGEPIDLQAVLAQHPGWTDERVARKVRRVLFIHLGREAMAIHGPKMKPPGMLRQEILERKRFRRELRASAERNGVPFEAALETARRDLKEIASLFNFEVVLLFGRALDFVFNRVFQGVEVDEAGMRRTKEAARHSRSAPLVLVPSHKSHVDYLVISWVFLRHEFIPPHIAAGANLSFFPLGPALRRAGAFFLRRSFAGNPLYKMVFRAYLWKLVREGYPIEFFMEGGRSRTGKPLPPKLGLLSMLMEGARRGEFKDLQFVPINLSYERVVETSSYRAELTGAEKRPESVSGVVRAGKVLRSRYGRIYVSFEEPVRLSEYLAGRGITDVTTTDDAKLRDTTHRLGYHLMRRIQEATIVAPSSLVGAVLLSHERRGLSGARLRELVGFLVDMLHRRGARLSRSIEHVLQQQANYIADNDAKGLRDGYRARGEALRPLIDEALALLRKLVQRTERGGDPIYVVPDRSRIELDYYRNTILGILAPDAIIATALGAAGRPLARAQLATEVRKLSYWFRLEFIYATDTTFEQNFDGTLARLVEEGLVADDGAHISAAAPLTLDFLRGTLRHLVEGYWIAADALRGLTHAPLDRKEWLEYAREHAEREFLQGDIKRAEAASTAVLTNALELFVHEGLVAAEQRPSGRRSVTVYRLAAGTSLEDVAFRRDDLGHFMVRRADEGVTRPPRGLAAVEAASLALPPAQDIALALDSPPPGGAQPQGVAGPPDALAKGPFTLAKGPATDVATAATDAKAASAASPKSPAQAVEAADDPDSDDDQSDASSPSG